MSRYNTQDDFWNKVNKETSTDCWEWTGSKCRDGYGLFKMNKQNVFLAHRWSVIFSGRDPAGKVVLHNCDNPACVNPDHLELGSQRDNVYDMHAKGRYRHKPSVLTDEQVREIRNASGTMKEIGKRYDISGNYTWHIRKGNARKDVK